MTFLPVVLREMSVLARRKGLYAGRFSLALGAVIVAGWILASSAAAISSYALGRTLFITLASMGFIYAMLAGVHATSDCLSEEKREDTLGLLFLTDLKSYDIVLGKMAAGSLKAAVALLGTVPIMALAIFLGGVSLGQLGTTSVVLASSIALSLGCGVMISSVSKNERKAMFATVFLLIVMTFSPFLIFAALSDGSSPPTAETFCVSPLYPLLCAFGMPGFDPSWFWISIALHSLLAVFFVCIAARVLPRFVNDLPKPRFKKLRDLAERMTFGAAETRRKHRAELLDRNAFLWLAGRERLKARYAWGMLGLFAAVYVWMWFQFTDLVYELPVAMTMMFLIHFAFKLWLASEVCSRLIEDRRSGALELLLSTPLKVEEIAHGQTLALRRIFLKPAIVLLVAEFLLFRNMLGQPRSLSSNNEIIIAMLAAPTTLLLDFWALKWVGLWLSLRGRSIERVLVDTATRVMTIPWVLFIGIVGLLGAMNLFGITVGLGSEGAFIIWWLLCMIIPLSFAVPARHRFLSTFREEAARRFDAPAVEKPAQAKKREPVPATAARPKRKPAWRSKAAWAAAALLLAGGCAARRAWWSAKLNEEIRRIEADGHPTGYKSISSFYPPVPARDDAAAAIQSARGTSFDAFGKNVRHNGNFGVENWQPLKLEVREKMRATIATNAVALAAFRKAVLLPNSYVPPDEAGRWMFRRDLYDCVTLFWMDGMMALDQKEAARAQDDILDLIRLARLLRHAPATQAQNACNLAFWRATLLLERLFSISGGDADFLEKLSQELKRADSPDLLKRQIILRRAVFLSRSSMPPSDPMGPRSPFVAAIYGLAEAIGTQQKWRWELLQTVRQGIDMAELPNPERLDALNKLDRSGGASLWLLPDSYWEWFQMGGVAALDALTSARTQVLKAVLVAERHRLLHGSLPEKWEDLWSSQAEPASDPFGAGPLLLRAAEGSSLMTVYSVGPNRWDDGGKVGEQHSPDVGFRFVTRKDARPAGE